jgi:hypothetical protein
MEWYWKAAGTLITLGIVALFAFTAVSARIGFVLPGGYMHLPPSARVGSWDYTHVGDSCISESAIRRLYQHPPYEVWPLH